MAPAAGRFTGTWRGCWSRADGTGPRASHVVHAADPGDPEAVETLCEALRRAEVGEHHREALALLDALLEMLPAGDRRWLKVLEVMPVTPDWVVDHRADADAEVGVRAMRRAEQVLERAGEPTQRAAVKFSLGSLLAWGLCELEPGRELVSCARDLFAEAGDQRAVLVATNELGYHAAMSDDGVTHERLAREVLAAAEEWGDPVLQLQALCSLAWALYVSGRMEASLVVIERGVKVARQADKHYRLCYLLGMGATIEHTIGRTNITAELEAAKEIYPAYRDTLLLDFAAQIAWQAGDLQAVVAAYRDQVAWDGGLSGRRAFGAGMAVISLAEMGRHDEAAAIQRAAHATFQGRSCWVMSRLIDWSGATADGLAGDPAEGLRRLAVAAEDSDRQRLLGWALWMVVDLAEAAAYAGESRAAIRADELLLGDPSPPTGPSYDAARAVVSAATSMALGKPVEAIPLLEQAVAAFGAVGWSLFKGRSLSLLGTALARHDRARAVETLEEAATRFASCGAVVRRERVLVQLAGLGPKAGARRPT